MVVETRGPEGVIIRRGGEEARVEAPKVEAVDTTGAGDCFNGVFAAGLAEGMEVQEAAERAAAPVLSRSRRSARARACRPATSSTRSSTDVMPTFTRSGYGAGVSEERRTPA